MPPYHTPTHQTRRGGRGAARAWQQPASSAVPFCLLSPRCPAGSHFPVSESRSHPVPCSLCSGLEGGELRGSAEGARRWRQIRRGRDLHCWPCFSWRRPSARPRRLRWRMVCLLHRCFALKCVICCRNRSFGAGSIRIVAQSSARASRAVFFCLPPRQISPADKNGGFSSVLLIHC